MASERAERLADVWDGAVGDPITPAEARQVLSLWRETTQLCNALNQLVNQYDALAAELEASRAREHALAEALAWVQDFASKMADRHTGFIHVERRSRAALAARGDAPEAQADDAEGAAG